MFPLRHPLIEALNRRRRRTSTNLSFESEEEEKTTLIAILINKTPKMSTRSGPPKHLNKYAWKPAAGCKKNETEPGGKFRPLAEVSGVCGRCKDQIEWKRKYGKYKLLKEPTKCNHCGKRAVRQAYHNLCSACAKQRGVCAKCCQVVNNIVGRDVEEVEAERKQLEEAIKNSRERDRRALLRAMNTNKPERMCKILKNEKKVEDNDNSDQSDSSDSDKETDYGDDDHKSESSEDIGESDGNSHSEGLKQMKNLGVS